MNCTELALPGVLLIESKKHQDERGYFMELYHEEQLAEWVGDSFRPFVQDNLSNSKKGVFRGMHMQRAPYGQSKYVRAVSGALLDIVLDVDPKSDTYGVATGALLMPDNGLALYIPRHYAHGFLALEEDTRIYYKVDEYYHPEAEVAFNYNHWTIIESIKPYFPLEELILSPKDLAAPLLEIKD